jgi:hypothetical protein
VRERPQRPVVRIAADEETHEISWAARLQLVVYLRGERGADVVRAAFHQAGTATVVELDEQGKRGLLSAIHAWANEVGAGQLPAHVVRLEHALATDVGDSSTGDATPSGEQPRDPSQHPPA